MRPNGEEIAASFSLNSSDFPLPARCAPHRAKAQRAAPFSKLGTIGFVPHDLLSLRRAARIRRLALELRTIAGAQLCRTAVTTGARSRHNLMGPPQSRRR